MFRITPEDFAQVEIRTGRVVRAEPFPEARNPAFRLWIDFGELGMRKSSAQITERYSTEALVGRLVVAVVNFPPKQVANFNSEVLVLGVHTERGVALLSVDGDVPSGARVC